MKPTAIWITGSYDAQAGIPGEGTNFINTTRESATHISVYLVEDHEIEPVQDFPLKPDSAKAYADALTLASQLAHEKALPIRDTYQNNVFRAPAYPQVKLVRGRKHTCASVRPGSTAADVCDCDAVVDGKPVPADQPFRIPDCIDCACVQDGQCLCTPSKPSAEKPLRVTDAMYHAFVEATRLQGNESETVKDLVMNGLEEAMAVYVPPEPVGTMYAELIKERDALRDLLRRCHQTCDMPPTLYAEVEKILPCVDEGGPLNLVTTR